MNRRIPLWAALSIGVAVFIGCGIFFALQDLGTANDYATIASFFLALLTAVGSLLSFVRSKQEDPDSAPPGDEQSRKPADRSLMIIGGEVGGIQQGDGNRLDLTDNPSVPHKRPPKRRGIWFGR